MPIERLNARSIFSLVASQHDCEAWEACSAWFAVLCALEAAFCALEAAAAAASADCLAAAASAAACFAAALAASMRDSVSLLVQPEAVATMMAAAATLSVFTIAVFIVFFLIEGMVIGQARRRLRAIGTVPCALRSRAAERLTDSRGMVKIAQRGVLCIVRHTYDRGRCHIVRDASYNDVENASVATGCRVCKGAGKRCARPSGRCVNAKAR